MVGSSLDSNETLLRAALESATYYHYIYNLNEEEFKKFKNEACLKFEKIFNKKIDFQKEDLVMSLLLPKSIYETFKEKNKKEYDEIMSLDKMEFFEIEMKKEYKETISQTLIGSDTSLFEIRKHNN